MLVCVILAPSCRCAATWHSLPGVPTSFEASDISGAMVALGIEGNTVDAVMSIVGDQKVCPSHCSLPPPPTTHREMYSPAHRCLGWECALASLVCPVPVPRAFAD